VSCKLVAALVSSSCRINIFKASSKQFEQRLRERGGDSAASFFHQSFHSFLQHAYNNPSSVHLDCIALVDRLHQDARAALDDDSIDPFHYVKSSENTKALNLLPKVLEQLDNNHESAHSRQLDALTGVLAGNCFDLGSAETVAQFESGHAGFEHCKRTLKPRPWLIDHADSAASLFRRLGAHGDCTTIFIDNAGSDAILGILPLARELLRAGFSNVVLAANSDWAVNDMTASNLVNDVLPHIEDPTLRGAINANSLRVVATGSKLPTLDLRNLSPEVRAEAKESSLIIIDGMARALETNFHVRLHGCYLLRLAVCKHEIVSRYLGGELFDLICKLDNPIPSKDT
jgi:type II pantothenate kinase